MFCKNAILYTCTHCSQSADTDLLVCYVSGNVGQALALFYIRSLWINSLFLMNAHVPVDWLVGQLGCVT